MSTTTAEVVEVIPGHPAATGTSSAARRRARQQAPEVHAQCACSPGLHQPAWIAECAYCGAGLN